MNPLSLDGQHGEVEGDEFQVAGGRGVVPPPQLLVEHLGHGTHAGVDLHAHLSYRFLGRERGGEGGGREGGGRGEGGGREGEGGGRGREEGGRREGGGRGTSDRNRTQYYSEILSSRRAIVYSSP